MESPSLQQFEIFLAVVDAGGFTAAARVLKVSKAAVSQSIKQLEQALQAPLFIRTTRSIQLTDEGALLKTQCLRLQNELTVARQLVNQFHREPSGTLRIMSTNFWAETKLLALLVQYRALYPKVKLEVLVGERMPDMKKENIDIVFGVNWQAPDDVIARTIGQTRYVVCAAPSYLAKHGTPETLQDLKEHDYIPHLGRKDKLLVGASAKQNTGLNTPLASDEASFMKQAAIAGLGIIQLHEYVVADALAAGSLVEILPNALKTATPLYMYYYKHRYVQPKIRQFINLCLGNITQ